MGDFGFRCAPLGPVPASAERATFFNFHRSRVERAIPDAWSFASVEELSRIARRSVPRGARRVRAALLSSGLPWPMRRVTVNLAPSKFEDLGKPSEHRDGSRTTGR
jgi:hypothetical protein